MGAGRVQEPLPNELISFDSESMQRRNIYCNALQIVTAIILLITWTIVVTAQSRGFEVAVIRRNDSGSHSGHAAVLRHGTLSATNVPLLSLLETAYGLSAEQISGPSWLKTERFDLAGKAPAGAMDSEFMPMLQLLLTERFQMMVHHETKEQPVFVLTIAKGGLKMPIVDDAHPPVFPANGGNLIGVGTTSQLAALLAREVERPVVDKTELPGRYIYALEFSSIDPTRAERTLSDSSAPDLFVAIQQQLGLKLEAKREAVEVLVIDSIQRNPIEN